LEDNARGQVHVAVNFDEGALLGHENAGVAGSVEILTDCRLQSVFDAAPQSLSEIHMLASNLYLHGRSPLFFQDSSMAQNCQ
jgi:hypothetical protein